MNFNIPEDQERGKKPAGFIHEYTEEQVKEIARCSVDPIYFIEKYVYIEHPTQGAMKFKLYDFQKNLLKTYIENNKLIAMLSRQCGKALTLDTPIPTPTGWTTMGEIKIGDQVIGEDGMPTTVDFATEVMYDHDVYEVEFDNGEKIKADAEHLWKIESNNHNRRKPSFLTTEEIIPIFEKAKSQGQSVRIRVSDPLKGEFQDLLIKPYTLGVWLGGGNSHDGRFTSHISDIEEIRENINLDGYTVSDPRPDKRRPESVNQNIYGIRPKLRDLGVLKNKHIPRKYLRASFEQRLELLKGLMDTDGHVRPRGHCEFYQKDRFMTENVFELVASLGLKPRIREKKIGEEIYHTVVFSTANFPVFKLERKAVIQERCLDHPKNHHFYIKEIRKIESEPVRCIRVDNDDHMFLCGKSMIPTHNTTTAAAFLLWWACFKKNQKILIASKDQDGANEIMERLWYAYEELPWWIKPGVRSDQVKTKKFDNNSVIRALATTATTGRGKANSIVYLDEFAYVRPGIADKFWTSLFPTLSTGGKCIITSTPNTDEDKFATIWFNSDLSPRSDEWHDPIYDQVKKLIGREESEEYETIYEDQEITGEYEEIDLEDEDEEQVQNFVGFHAHWTKVPDRDGKMRGARFKKEQFKGGLTNEEWMREFECAFVTGEETLISPARLSILRKFLRKPRFVDQWNGRWYEEIKPNMGYAVVLDPSEGVDLDDACIQVWEIPTLKQVYEWNNNKTDQTEQTKMLRRTLQRIHLLQQNNDEHYGDVNIYYSVERNGLGIGVLNLIEVAEEGTFIGWRIDATHTSFNVRGSKGGFDKPMQWSGLLTSVSTKKRFCIEFKSLVERNLFLPRSAELISQMKTFVKKGQSWKAKEGSKDDIVMSCVLMCHMIEELKYQEPDLEEYIRVQLEDNYDPEDATHPLNNAYAPIV